MDRAPGFEIEVNGRPIRAFPGETLVATLVAAGILAFGRGPRGALRGPCCGMGACFGCLVNVEGLGRVQACLVRCRPHMKVRLEI
ncbi:MAG: (2Fe-2S)-binding protein [Planctomycetes bacterium]|nr:(2Fe-2S)-binding protein [Planctomycetota bacterium]